MALALAMVFLVSSLFFVSADVSADDSWDRMISSRVDADRAMDHLYMLSKKIGPRVSGMKSEKQAAKYIATQLKRHGYQIDEQDRKSVV